MTLSNALVILNRAQLGVARAATLHVRGMDRRVVTVDPARPIVRLVDRDRCLLGAHLLVLAKRKRAWVVIRSHDFAAVAVAVTLLVGDIVGNDSLDFGRDVLSGATRTEVPGSARLATTMALALHDLPTHVRHVGRVLALVYGLVDVHGGLDVLALRIQPRHLNVLHLCLINARALPREELLLIIAQDSVLNIVAFGSGAFTFGEFLVRHTVGFVVHIASSDFDIRMAHLCLLTNILFGYLMVLDMNHARRAGGHVLRLKHLLLEVLAMPELILLNRKTKAWVMVIAHGHLMMVTYGTMASTGNHDCLAAILIVLRWAVLAMGLLKLI